MSDRARRYSGAFRLPQPTTRAFAPASSSPPVATPPTPSVVTAPAQVHQLRTATAGGRLHPEKAALRPPITYTDEQGAIIEAPDHIVVANAFAGTGKSTTAEGFARARPRHRFLYICFNKPVQLQAEARFGRGSNTECRTTHSLAYQAFGRAFEQRITRGWRALTVRNEMNLPNTRAAAMVQAVLTAFFHSADREIRLEHAAAAEHGFNASDREVGEAVANAKLLWRRMQDRSDNVAITDDAYLKMWALSDPTLDYDYIICDEWQDANPITAQIIKQQRAKLLVLGDRHQSIYAFRGATNAMEHYPGARHLHLTQTWRFGSRVADVANLILGELKQEKFKITGMAPNGQYKEGAAIMKLARTNAQLFRDATLVHGQGVHWIGGVDKYGLTKITDAYQLFANRRDQVADPFLRHFHSFEDLTRYAEEAKDREVKILAQIIDQYRHDTPQLVDEIVNRAVRDPADAQLILTTAHKAKGLESEHVQLADDFEILNETEEALANDPSAAVEEQEINLLYVAATRAKQTLTLNDETKHWIDALPRHRAARAQAIARARARFTSRQAGA